MEERLLQIEKDLNEYGLDDLNYRGVEVWEDHVRWLITNMKNLLILSDSQ